MLRENDFNSFAHTKCPDDEQATFPPDRPVSVLLFDDRRLVLESVAALLRSRIDNPVIQGRCDLEDLDFEPTIIVVLGRACSQSSLDVLTERMRRLAPRSTLVAFIDAGERGQIALARSYGVRCVHDLASLAELVEAAATHIRTNPLAAQRPGVNVDSVIDEGTRPNRDVIVPAAIPANLQQLTQREREVLERLDRGLPNKIIAYELGISCCTVKVHIRNILQKFKARNRTQAAFLARQRPVESFARP